MILSHAPEEAGVVVGLHERVHEERYDEDSKEDQQLQNDRLQWRQQRDRSLTAGPMFEMRASRCRGCCLLSTLLLGTPRWGCAAARVRRRTCSSPPTRKTVVVITDTCCAHRNNPQQQKASAQDEPSRSALRTPVRVRS